MPFTDLPNEILLLILQSSARTHPPAIQGLARVSKRLYTLYCSSRIQIFTAALKEHWATSKIAGKFPHSAPIMLAKQRLQREELLWEREGEDRKEVEKIKILERALEIQDSIWRFARFLVLNFQILHERRIALFEKFFAEGGVIARALERVVEASGGGGAGGEAHGEGSSGASSSSSSSSSAAAGLADGGSSTNAATGDQTEQDDDNSDEDSEFHVPSETLNNPLVSGVIREVITAQTAKSLLENWARLSKNRSPKIDLTVLQINLYMWALEDELTELDDREGILEDIDYCGDLLRRLIVDAVVEAAKVLRRSWEKEKEEERIREAEEGEKEERRRAEAAVGGTEVWEEELERRELPADNGSDDQHPDFRAFNLNLRKSSIEGILRGDRTTRDYIEDWVADETGSWLEFDMILGVDDDGWESAEYGGGKTPFAERDRRFKEWMGKRMMRKDMRFIGFLERWNIMLDLYENRVA